MVFVHGWKKFPHALDVSLLARFAKNCSQLYSFIVMYFSMNSLHDLIFPGLVCRYAGEFVSEILAGIKTPERKKEEDNAEEGKQRAR